MDSPAPLNPAQQEVLDQLGAAREDRPRFDAVLRHELRRALEDGLAPLTERVDDRVKDTVFISKHALGQVLGCERKYLAEEAEPFAWRVPMVRGTVAHKAIELSIHWRREPEPLALIDEATSRLAEGTDTLADFLQGCTEVERAEIRAEANDRVVKFMECFPPLKTGWRPVTEGRLRLEIHDRFVLSGKVDLALGQAEGDRAGKVLIDLKTGQFSPQHLEDLRYYALIEAVRLGTPPRRVATYYLDQGRFVPEDVNEGLLFAAAARVIDGATRIVELRGEERDATLAPGPACRWCPVLHECDTGRRHLEEADEDAGW